MSLLTGIKALFAAPKTIDKAVEVGDKVATGIIAGLDKIWHTEEEKSDAQQLANDTLLKFWGVIANENTEQSKARRELAKMVFKTYLSLLLMAVAVYRFDAEYAAFIFKVAGTLTALVMGVAAIYFGPQQISKVWKKKS